GRPELNPSRMAVVGNIRGVCIVRKPYQPAELPFSPRQPYRDARTTPRDRLTTADGTFPILLHCGLKSPDFLLVSRRCFGSRRDFFIRDLARPGTSLPTNGQCTGFVHTDVAPLLKPGDLGDSDLSGNQIEENTHRVLERGEVFRFGIDWRPVIGLIFRDA